MSKSSDRRECESGPHEMTAEKKQPSCSVCRKPIEAGELYYSNNNNKHVRRHAACAAQVRSPLAETKRMVGSHRGERRERKR